MSHMADTTEKREIVVNAYAKQSCLPVTSLEYVTIGQSELLLAGRLFSRVTLVQTYDCIDSIVFTSMYAMHYIYCLQERAPI